ncbi:MAG: GNAT family N-acetyltransferase [Defluviitaleaceae bacterium]|nr:GNAT family N-acetyltransferase [Defluviitaleaceae bacterium]
MKPRETERLILRPFKEDDFEAVHSYAGNADNTYHMLFGPNSEEETRVFISYTMGEISNNPISVYDFAVILKETGNLIGGCGLHINKDRGSLGWIFHRDYWGNGYGTEVGAYLLNFGFDELNLRRIVATASAENPGSIRIMEKLGMRQEALHQDSRKAREGYFREYYDECQYAILRDEWEIQKEIAHYNTLPCEFNGFIDVPLLNNGDIYLVCTQKSIGNPEKKHVPGYTFAICKNGEKVGDIGLRIGYGGGHYNSNLYYGGQIGYGIDEAHRGKGYAVEACRLVAPIAKAHKMEKLLITNDYRNAASRRVCEKLGAKLVRLARLPEWTDMYKEGQRFSNIYEWSI